MGKCTVPSRSQKIQILSYVNPAQSWKITIMVITSRELEIMMMKTDEDGNINKKGEITSSGSMMPTTSQKINTLKMDINALTRTSWLHDGHIDLTFEDIR